MASVAKALLSGSTNGKAIKVAATATPGTLIHTAVAGTSNLDEVWVYAENTDTATRKLTVQWGGVASPDDTVIVSLPAQAGLVLVIPGLPLQNGLVVRAFADAANVVTIVGFVNQITA